MTPDQRVRLARRHAGLSQAALAAAVGVQRSAVSHWEAPQSKHPSVSHLRQVAMVTGVQFEWLATGRGKMTLGVENEWEGVSAVDALMVEDPLEVRLLTAFRDAPMKARAPLVEVLEQLASRRSGRRR